jgi:NADPH:quinone reductase-like Zn-dependent oxidoreductase
MRAVVQDRYGDAPEQVLRLGTVPRPVLREADVLVRVRAASVDRGTWHLMAGVPYPMRIAGFGLRRPKAGNPGRSFAGTVVTAGSAVTEVHAGDEVYGTCEGAFAEYVRAPIARVTRKPSTMSFEQAAAVPVSGLTALQAVRDHGHVGPGRHVLVIGASGGVGTFAVQIARAYGASVTGVCSTEKVELVRSLADHVVDYLREDPLGGDQRYDVILDIGGNRRLSRLRGALTPRGRLVIVGAETGGRWLGGNDRQIRALLVSPFVSQTLGTFINRENAADLDVLRELIEAGKVVSVVDRTYPLDRTVDAIRYLQDGHASGKVVVTV